MKFDYPLVSHITPDLRGFYRIGHEAYHQGPGISSSRVKKALVSKAHFDNEEKLDTPALAFGRAFHTAILEPGLFATQYACEPEIPGHKNSNAYKATYAAFVERNTGKTVIDREDWGLIEAMVRAIKGHPEYAKLPRHDAEIMAIAECPETGLLIKCKTDLFTHSIVDFKSTSSGARDFDFMNDLVKWGYHVSAALYQYVISLVIGQKLDFIVVPVTKSNPVECEFYKLSDEFLEEGRKLMRAGLKRIAKWQKGEPEPPKTLRVLHPNSRLVYNTQAVLQFLGEK